MITRRWALDRGAEVQTCTSDSVAFNMFLHFDLKTIPLVGYPKIYQNIYIYIYIPSLKTLGSFVFELCCGQTDRRTHTQTDSGERFAPMTVVGVNNDWVKRCINDEVSELNSEVAIYDVENGELVVI